MQREMDRPILPVVVLLLLLGYQLKCKSVSGNSTDEDDSWLPPKTAITEEIDAINEADHATGLVDLDVKPSPDDDGRSNGYNEKRNAVRRRCRLWRSRIIPYVLDDSLEPDALKWIKVAMEEFHDKTCIRFKKQTSGNNHHIRIFKGLGCFSYIGKTSLRKKNYQDLSIGKGCEHKGIVIHELMHAIGFYHEQSRYDRDKYVKIIESNIYPGEKHNFAKRKIQEVTGLGLPYDYDGVMHYGAYAFARDRSMPTIEKLKKTGGPIGQTKGFSKTDLEQINLLYDCKTDSSFISWSSWSQWSLCFNAGSGEKEHSQRFCFRDDLSQCPGADSDGIQSRERACRSVPETPSTTNKPDVITQPTQSSTGNSINEPICGTRATSLAHPVLHPQHIVGGQDALPGDWPWQVGIAAKGSTFIYCGGTLISSEWILGAAHCFKGARAPLMTTARLGEHNKKLNEGNEEVITLSHIIKHPLYDKRTLDYDIALLKLSKQVNYTRYIRPACVPSSDFKVNAGADAFVSGWGRIVERGRTSAILQVANVPIIANDKCGYRSRRLTDRMLCAGYANGKIDSCEGDSGGPLVLENEKGKFDLIGVVSWGVGCARRNRGGVYASVPVLRSFIDEVIASNLTSQPTTLPGKEGSVSNILTCSFEKDLCNWKQSKSDEFDWTRMKGGTTSPGTGPLWSSTGLNGYYLYIETSSPRRKGDTATLISPEIRLSSPSCFSFKAHLNGKSTNTLTIVRVQGRIKVYLWEKTGDQDNRWHAYEFNLPAGGPYKIEITGVCGEDYRGDIAIDELKVSPNPCGKGIDKNPPQTGKQSG